MAEERSRRCPPFLVEIQNVDISSLDFHQGLGNGISSIGPSENGTKSKSRHVTFVEATTLFLYVGSTSGTVYLFSRESLDFLLMLPFKGGKVCNISASNDESDVAVASIRGRVSLYRMSPNIHFLQSQKTSNRRAGLRNGSSSNPAEAFLHLYDVPHHVNNEVTEMSWSSNGKFLFVGDNQGLISQIDMGSFEEFPRPPPSRVILTLQSRILQIVCNFPYLAISTLNATFLCDLEKEDFTRIQTDGLRDSRIKRDIRSAGLCIICQDHKMLLLIGEVGTGTIFRCRMDGSVISSIKIDLSPMICNPVGCFDPKQSDSVIVNNKPLASSGDLNFSSGKMFLTDDDQFIISVSSNRVFVYDAKTCKLLLWNEDFNRINSLKIIANYGFLWYANKLQVFALTAFRPYGKQLFRAGLNSVLENWISYAITSMGYQDCDKEKNAEIDNERGRTLLNLGAIKLFREIMFPIDEEDEFCEFVSSYIPFDLIDPEVKRKLLQEESYDKKLKRCVKQLIDSASVVCSGSNSDVPFFEKILTFFEALQQFYSALCNSSTSPLVLPMKTPNGDNALQNLTLLNVLSSTHIFLRHPKLLNLKQDLVQYSLANAVIDNVAGPILKLVFSSKRNENCAELFEFGNSNFLHFAKSEQKYFQELGIPSNMLCYDALVADTIILLLPLVGDTVLYKSLMQVIEPYHISSMFFTWMVIMTFFGDKTHTLPFSGLLRTIQNPQYFEKLEEVMSSVYREVIFPRVVNDAQTSSSIQTLTLTCFTHFMTFAILYSKCPEISTVRNVNLILTLFPLKRGVRGDLIQKIIHLTTLNPVFLQMYYKACLKDGKSFKLCRCGIQGCHGSLEKVIPPFQRAIEEAVFHQLVKQHFENQSEHSGESNGHGGNGDQTLFKTPVHRFAMKRCLILPYLESSVADDIISDDKIKLTMLLRSGKCGGLQHVRFNLENLEVLQKALKQAGNDFHLEKALACESCGMELSGVSSKGQGQHISMDCVGVWMLENVSSIDRFMQIQEEMGFNSRGVFSLRFYQLVIKRDELRYEKGKRKQGEDFSCTSLTCSILHH